jgi:hypothetical protein
VASSCYVCKNKGQGIVNRAKSLSRTIATIWKTISFVRINKAKGAFAQLRPIWASHQIHKRTKIRIFKSNVMSVLLYGCETWKITQDIIDKLQTSVNRCLRNILRIWWPKTITNKELWETTQQIPIDRGIKIRKWKWIGRTFRKYQKKHHKAGTGLEPTRREKEG